VVTRIAIPILARTSPPHHVANRKLGELRIQPGGGAVHLIDNCRQIANGRSINFRGFLPVAEMSGILLPESLNCLAKIAAAISRALFIALASSLYAALKISIGP
jgi:hypothetical protein